LSCKYEEEKILVVPNIELMNILDFKEGLIEMDLDVIKNLIRNKGFFKERNLVENDESLRQVIPYVVIKSNGKFLLVKRLETQGERRLHNKYSVGIGGHINISDFDGKDIWSAVEKGMWRELNEEVKISPIGEPEFLGIINDLSSSVSRVHIGLCYIIECEFHEINEKDKFEEAWVEKFEGIDNMEGWSKIVVKKISGGN